MSEVRSLIAELIECVADWSGQYGCSCGHTACKSCDRTLGTAGLLARARMKVNRKPLVVQLQNVVPPKSVHIITLPGLKHGTTWGKSGNEQVLYWKPFQKETGRWGVGKETEIDIRSRNLNGVVSFTDETVFLCEKGNIAVGIRHNYPRHLLSVLYKIEFDETFSVVLGFGVRSDVIGALSGRLLARRCYDRFRNGAVKMLLEKHGLSPEDAV